MRTADDPGRRGGFTVIEALIVLAILGIVAVLAVDTFRGTMEKYRVEGETKQMYADLMNARGQALQRNRASFVQVEAFGYSTYEDTFNPPDGNGSLDNTTDVRIAGVTIRHAVTSALAGGSYITFRRDGTSSVTGYLHLEPNFSTARPDYDCVGIGITRLHLGLFNGTNACVEK